MSYNIKALDRLPNYVRAKAYAEIDRIKKEGAVKSEWKKYKEIQA